MSRRSALAPVIRYSNIIFAGTLIGRFASHLLGVPSHHEVSSQRESGFRDFPRLGLIPVECASQSISCGSLPGIVDNRRDAKYSCITSLTTSAKRHIAILTEKSRPHLHGIVWKDDRMVFCPCGDQILLFLDFWPLEVQSRSPFLWPLRARDGRSRLRGVTGGQRRQVGPERAARALNACGQWSGEVAAGVRPAAKSRSRGIPRCGVRWRPGSGSGGRRWR